METNKETCRHRFQWTHEGLDPSRQYRVRYTRCVHCDVSGPSQIRSLDDLPAIKQEVPFTLGVILHPEPSALPEPSTRDL